MASLSPMNVVRRSSCCFASPPSIESSVRPASQSPSSYALGKNGITRMMCPRCHIRIKRKIVPIKYSSFKTDRSPKQYSSGFGHVSHGCTPCNFSFFDGLGLKRNTSKLQTISYNVLNLKIVSRSVRHYYLQQR